MRYARFHDSHSRRSVGHTPLPRPLILYWMQILLGLTILLLVVPTVRAQSLVTPDRNTSQGGQTRVPMSLVYLDGMTDYGTNVNTVSGWAFGCGVALVDVQLAVTDAAGNRTRIPYQNTIVSGFLLPRPDVRQYFEGIGYCADVPMWSGVIFGVTKAAFPGPHVYQLYIKDSTGSEYYSNAVAAAF